MKTFGPARAAIEEIAEQLEVYPNWQGKNDGLVREGVYRFTLRPSGSRWREQFEGGRDVAVCFHGQERFLEALFDRFPTATVETALTTYHGARDFERKRKLVRIRYYNELKWGDDACDCAVRAANAGVSA